ncbi:MAG: pyrimidine 5'-nucleotidase [Proteobacteria bacterium]|nr:pyrimidine 5'-nucleotidase [Pseudomonadota bacterium]
MAEANPSLVSGLEGAGMAAVEHWVFDLDNTLYSAQCRIFHQIDRRMGEFIAGLLGLAYEDARRLQKKYFHTYGTTLRGLMNNHQVDPSAYLEFVHDIDLTAVAPDLALDAALARLPGIKVIFTNASRGHAEQVIRALGVARHFAAIFDIQDAGYLPKPEPETYDRFIARHRIAPQRSVLFEDSVANLKPAAALGMTTVLVTPGEEGVDNHGDADHVHFVTDDLAGWLENAARDTAPGGGGPA